MRIAPEELFAYLRDVENLPRYLPYLESVRSLGGDRFETTAQGDPDSDAGPDGRVKGEAWMRVVEDGKRLEWGAPGPNDYAGSLDVDEGDSAEESSLTVRLHTERAEGEEIQQSLRATLDGLKQAVESQPPPS